METFFSKYPPKASFRPFFVLVNNPKQPLKSFESRLSRSLRKLTLFFLSNPVSFNGQDYKTTKGTWN